MDGLHHVGELVDGQVAHLPVRLLDLVRVLDQTLHLGFGTAVSELQVVEHGVVAARQTLVGLLDGLDVGAHLVGVVRHVDHGGVAEFRGLRGVAAERADQRGGKARDLRHVLVGAHSGCPVRFRSVFLHGAGRVFEQRVHAADGLLVGRVCVESALADAGQSRDGGANTCQSDRGDALQRAYGLARHGADRAPRGVGSAFELRTHRRRGAAGGPRNLRQHAADRAADVAEITAYAAHGILKWCRNLRGDAVDALAEPVGQVVAELSGDGRALLEGAGDLASQRGRLRGDLIERAAGDAANLAEHARPVEHGHVGVRPAGAHFLDRTQRRGGHRPAEVSERRSERTGCLLAAGGEIVLRVLERLLRILQPVLGLRRPVGHGGQLQPSLFEPDGRGLGLRATLTMLGDGIGDALLGGTHLIRRRPLLEHGLTVCGRGFRHVALVGFQHVRAEIVRRLSETVFERASEQSTAFAAVHA